MAALAQGTCSKPPAPLQTTGRAACKACAICCVSSRLTCSPDSLVLGPLDGARLGAAARAQLSAQRSAPAALAARASCASALQPLPFWEPSGGRRKAFPPSAVVHSGMLGAGAHSPVCLSHITHAHQGKRGYCSRARHSKPCKCDEPRRCWEGCDSSSVPRLPGQGGAGMFWKGGARTEGERHSMCVSRRASCSAMPADQPRRTFDAILPRVSTSLRCQRSLCLSTPHQRS